MADLFDEILKQASNNTKTVSKELKKIDRSVEEKKRLRAEKDAVERKLMKEAIKKKVPAPPPKPKFCIPKLSASSKGAPTVDKNRVTEFIKKREEEKRREEIEKQHQKEKLMKLRLEAYGGKANKKIAKQFGITPIEYQQRFGTDRDHEDFLKKQQMREEEEADRLCTELRGGVFKALERKKTVDKDAPSLEDRKAKGPHRVASNKQNSLRYFTKEDSPGPGPSSSKSKPSDKMKRPNGPLGKKPVPNNVEKRRPPPPALDFTNLMRKAEAIQKGEPVPASPPPPAPRKEPSSRTERSDAERSRFKGSDDSSFKKSVPKAGNLNGNAEKFRNERIAKPASSAAPVNKYGIGVIKAKSSDSVSASASRDAGKPRMDKPSSLSSAGSSKEGFRKPLGSAPRADVKPSSAPKPSSSIASSGKKFLPGDIRFQPGAASRAGPSDVVPRQRIPPAASGRDRVGQPADSRNMVKTNGDRKRPDTGRKDYDAPLRKKERPDNDYASRAGYEEYLRYKQRQIEMRRRQAEEEEMEDEEHDSDMDSFIDDSEFDELSRKDFEETLRLVNPRYNKKRWELNERLIDDRFMEARYHDVAREELRSSKIGLLEDLREAQRGASFAL